MMIISEICLFFNFPRALIIICTGTSCLNFNVFQNAIRWRYILQLTKSIPNILKAFIIEPSECRDSAKLAFLLSQVSGNAATDMVKHLSRTTFNTFGAFACFAGRNNIKIQYCIHVSMFNCSCSLWEIFKQRQHNNVKVQLAAKLDTSSWLACICSRYMFMVSLPRFSGCEQRRAFVFQFLLKGSPLFMFLFCLLSAEPARP